jgi:hypothetical protein
MRYTNDTRRCNGLGISFDKVQVHTTTMPHGASGTMITPSNPSEGINFKE